MKKKKPISLFINFVAWRFSILKRTTSLCKVEHCISTISNYNHPLFMMKHISDIIMRHENYSLPFPIVFIHKQRRNIWLMLKVVSFFKMLPKIVPIFSYENFNSNVTKKMWNKCMYDAYLEIIKWCHVLGFSPICRVFLFSHFCLESIIYNLSCAPLALVNMLNHNKRGIFISNMTNKNNENILLWFFFKTSTMVLSNFTPMEQRFQFDLFTYLKPMTLATLLNHVNFIFSVHNPSNHVA